MIKNIVFDFGGVLIDLEPQKTMLALEKVLQIEDIATLIRENQTLLDDFEKGHLRYENFLWNMQRLGKIVPDPKQTINAWNAMLLGWNPAKLALLESLKNKYSLFLLSNTNEIHMQWVKNDLWFNHGIQDFDTRYFNQTFYSYTIGMKKPDIEIFQYVIHKTAIVPNESLYIDDLEENVNTASALGFQTILHPRNASLDYLL